MTTNVQPQTPLEILIAAKALIGTPEKWLKDTYSAYRKKDGDISHAGARKPNCFCGFGAVYVAAGLDAFADDPTRAVRSALGFLSKATEGRPQKFKHRAPHFPHFNDHPDTIHEDVMAVFDSAIALAKADEVPVAEVAA